MRTETVRENLIIDVSLVPGREGRKFEIQLLLLKSREKCYSRKNLILQFESEVFYSFFIHTLFFGRTLFIISKIMLDSFPIFVNMYAESMDDDNLAKNRIFQDPKMRNNYDIRCWKSRM